MQAAYLAVHHLQVPQVSHGVRAPSGETECGEVGAEESVGRGLVAAEPRLGLPRQRECHHQYGSPALQPHTTIRTL